MLVALPEVAPSRVTTPYAPMRAVSPVVPATVAAPTLHDLLAALGLGPLPSARGVHILPTPVAGAVRYAVIAADGHCMATGHIDARDYTDDTRAFLPLFLEKGDPVRGPVRLVG